MSTIQKGRISPSDLRGYPRPVVDVLCEAVNAHEIPYRHTDGNHLLLYTGDREDVPFKVARVRPAEFTLRKLKPWLADHYQVEVPKVVQEIKVTRREEPQEAQEPAQEAQEAAQEPVEPVVVPEPHQEPQEPQEPAQEAQEPVEWDPTTNFGFVKIAGRWTCQHPGCTFSRANRRGLHLHINAHAASLPEPEPEPVVEPEPTPEAESMRQAVIVLAHGLGLAVVDQAEVEALREQVRSITAERDEAQARLALIQEAFQA